ncbi:membrane-associated tyrosine- and threonine-specific cdc2-inhibitory kinase-like protein [Leptotrombidium deliense]|uniref:Membrane-associated tyrosine- and threonine-specific cdc2-inhibitory kinase n=1 Tax=Leptotrombidium deliense TaxID=299467 RepID=A0A443SM69_9ACAR|nr:membrane-associated tyrosine- and threonine-specific cdc2-inhibitory kinase-like protein [Leptotrombidium deliense]
MNTPTLPLPQFVKNDTLLVSKKAMRSTPKKVPPRPPCKWSLPIARFSSSQSSKAQAVSFRDNDTSTLSKQYDETREESYFDQCFKVFEKIGSGSFGDVFKVRSKEDGIYYAVKKSRERFKGKGDRERKLDEVAKHEQLPKHLNLVRFYKAWEEKQCLYIQTELCDSSLSEFLECNHEVKESLVWNYLIDLLFAVKHLHERNLIHLDIKPDNIFISRDGICKLGDFGLMVDLSKNELNEAMEGDPKYLAKELMQGKFTKAADIFSLGITTLELACDLDLPSGGQSWHQLRSGEIPAELTKSLSTSSHFSLTHLYLDLSNELKKVIVDMMNPNFQERPTAESLLNYPVINKLALKRKLQLQTKKYYRNFIEFFHKFFYCIFNLSFLSCVCDWFRTKVFPNSVQDLKTPPHNSSKKLLIDWDNSFSDEDIFDANNTSHISDGFSSSSEDRSFTSLNNHSRHNSTAIRHRKQQMLTSSPYLTPIRKETYLRDRSPFKDISIDGKSSLSQRLSFCDISEDEDNDNESSNTSFRRD